MDEKQQLPQPIEFKPLTPHKPVQEYLIADLLETGSDDNETLQLMEHMRKNGVPLTNEQASAAFFLQEMGLGDIADHVFAMRVQMTPVSRFMKLLDKLTLADRIKGNAKLSSILKANANPANAQIPMGIKDGVK